MGKGAGAPKPYMPTGQGAADQGWQNLLSSTQPWVSSLPSSVIPGLQGAVSGVQNNPYYPGAQQGANNVADLAGGTVAPAMFSAADALYGSGMNSLGAGAPMMQQLMGSGDASYQQGRDASGVMQNQGNLGYWNGVNTGNTLAGLAPQLQQTGNEAYGQGQALAGRATDMIPSTVNSGIANADPFYLSGMNKANKAWATAYQAIPGLTGGMTQANQMLNNGFDPQGQLYDREFQKMQDQQNAINSMYGVSGSAYGAGVAGDASRNFNLDWQDRSLGRQLSALQGYGGYTGQVTNNLTGLLGSASNNYNTLSQGAVKGFNDLLNGSVDRGTKLMDTASTALNRGAETQRLGYDDAGKLYDMSGQAIDRGITAQRNNYESASTIMNRGVDNQRLGYGTGADIYNSMNADGRNSLGAASSHATDALNTLYTSSQLPSSTYTDNINQQIQALQALAQGGAASLGPSFNLGQQYSDYLHTGQNATALGQNAAQINHAASASNSAGIGQLAGMFMGPGGPFASLAGGSGISSALASVLGPMVGLDAAGAAALTSSMGAVVSDRRLKHRIFRIGMWKGLALYSYAYLGSLVRHIGVMAQDVLKVRPDAVLRMPNGYMAVQYGDI